MFYLCLIIISKIGGQRRGAFHPRNLPVANGGIFAHRALLQAGKGANGLGLRLLRLHAVQMEQAQTCQIGATLRRRVFPAFVSVFTSYVINTSITAPHFHKNTG